MQSALEKVTKLVGRGVTGQCQAGGCQVLLKNLLLKARCVTSTSKCIIVQERGKSPVKMLFYLADLSFPKKHLTKFKVYETKSIQHVIN